MRYVLIILIAVSVGFAQPELDTYSISVNPYQISWKTIAHSSGVDTVVLWTQVEDRIFYLQYDLNSSQIIAGPSVIGGWSVTNQFAYLDDAILLENNQWAMCYRTNTVNGTFDYTYESRVVLGQGTTDFSVQTIYTAHDDGNEFAAPGPLVNVNLVALPETGYAVIGNESGRWGVEPMAQLFVYGVSCLTGEIIQGHNVVVFPQLRNDDTLVVLATTALGVRAAAVNISIDCDESNCCSLNTADCCGWPVVMFTTSGNRNLVITSSDSLYEFSGEVMFPISDIGYELPWNFIFDSHPDFGVAFAFDEGNSITVVRIDTLGQIIGGVGTVSWGASSGPHHVSIADNGEILLTWKQGESTIGLARFYWDTPLSTPERPTQLPETYSLSAFPNPFNSEVRIEYSISQPQEIELTVFNSLGQQVATLVKEHSTVGNHSVSWSPTTGSGIYFVKLNSDNFNQTTKLLYLR